MRTVGAAKFKEHCLELLDSLGPEGIIITKRGRPVARLVRVDRESAALIGSLRGKIRIRGNILSTGLDWKVDAEP